jgi:hypothetical protein
MDTKMNSRFADASRGSWKEKSRNDQEILAKRHWKCLAIQLDGIHSLTAPRGSVISRSSVAQGFLTAFAEKLACRLSIIGDTIVQMHAKGLNICLKGMTRKWLGLLGIACYQAAGWLAGAEPLLAVFRAAQAMDEAIPKVWDLLRRLRARPINRDRSCLPVEPREGFQMPLVEGGK